MSRSMVKHVSSLVTTWLHQLFHAMFSWSYTVHVKTIYKKAIKQILKEGRNLRTSPIANMARVVKIDSTDIKSQVALAAQSLKAGNVIAVPTDTIYGVAVLAQDSKAVNKLFDVKKRYIGKAVAISIGEIDDVYKWGKVTVSRDVLSDLLPGPVTVVFERSPDLNPDLNTGTSSVGIRIPDHDFIRNIARRCGEPIALTSANISSQQSPLSIEEFKVLWPHLDLVFDGGQLGDTHEARAGSTVVDLTRPGHFTIIRDGSAYKATVDVLANKHSLQQMKR